MALVKIIKLIGCIALGLGMACIGMIVRLGVAGVPWLGLIVGAALVMVGSLLSAELAEISGGALYACTAFIATIALILAPPSIDMLTVPPEAGEHPFAQIWPMLLLVCALIPLRFKFLHSLPSDE